ncbi:glycosyltransferase family 4 protein [Saccharicrinis fermentans]|nr:glycosyltransferase family 1 protein [Saccharicrinis fermentans]
MKISTGENRLRLGLLFNFQPSWMGGITYIINIVKTLNYLNDEDKPEIYLLVSKDLEKYLSEISYPYLHVVKWNHTSVAKGFLKSWLKGKNIFIDDIIDAYRLDAIYPVRDCPVKSTTKAKVIAWYADLQHKFYPEFFTQTTILHRNIRLKFMLRNTDMMVVSSQAVRDDFQTLFKRMEKVNFQVYHFVSIMDGLEALDFQSLKEKYQLPEKYFMVANQFHRHKNHKAVLLALVNLKAKGIIQHIAFTGRFPSASNSAYMAELHHIIDDNHLHDQISMLGMIPRNEQISLMSRSQAVIQPSLFEGWSTVIEDAKSLQVPVIASNIKVNKEQLGEAGDFFEPHNSNELADILKNYPDRNWDAKFYDDHNIRIKDAAQILLDIFKK